MAQMQRHIGVLRNTSSRVYIAWRSLPDEPDQALVIYRDSLPGPYADPVYELVMGRAQESTELYEVMDKIGRLDGANMFTILYKTKYLVKVPTASVDVHLGGDAKISLDKLNESINSSKNTIDSGYTKTFNPLEKVQDIQYSESTGIVAQLLEEAARHRTMADNISERAYALDPTQRPKPDAKVTDDSVLVLSIPKDITQAKAVDMVKQLLKEAKNASKSQGNHS